jgi:hypothetical protein
MKYELWKVVELQKRALEIVGGVWNTMDHREAY